MKIKKWLFWSLFSVALLVVLALIVVYAGSETTLNRTYDIPLTSVAVPSDSVSINEGERLAQIFHCSGCHGEGMTGKVFFTVPNVATVVAPNISERLPLYSDEALEWAIRHGIKKDGHGAWMPVSTQYYHMSDADLGKLIAYLRTVPVRPSAVSEETSIKILGRIGVLTGEFTQPAASIDHHAKRIVKDTTRLSIGKYYATTVCAACHGVDFKGVPDPGHPSPPLAMAKAYTFDQFYRLMKTGEGLTRKDLGLMSIMSSKHFKYFTDSEIRSIHDFLQTLP